LKIRRFLFFWLGFNLFVHLLAGVFTWGYYDFDEHFQILEFMNQRLLGGDGRSLAWEFHAQMRPWLQPFFYEVFARILIFFGDRDPGHWVLVFRVVSSLLGWLSLVALSFCSLQFFESTFWKKNAVRFLCLFWYRPFLHARTSSENFAGTFFWLGFSGLIWAGVARTRLLPLIYIFSGILLGLSFEFRYQMIIAIAGLFCWVAWENSKYPHRVKLTLNRMILWSFTGLGLALALGTFLDFWGYSKVVFAPFNYFYQNIILKRAAEVSIDPAIYYFSDLAHFTFPLGFLTIIGVLASCILVPAHPLNWVVIPYFLVHTAIAHKEQRFLYPVWPVFPILFALSLESFQKSRPQLWRRYVHVLRRVGIGMGILSLILMLYLSLKPITARPGFYLAVFRHQPEIKTLYFLGENPYEYGGGLAFNFYKKPELKLIPVRVASDLPANVEFWLFHDQFEPPREVIGTHSCALEFTVFPSWLKAFTIFSGPARFASRWSLFHCR
jgi:phosphatidylinositol glycan class B